MISNLTITEGIPDDFVKNKGNYSRFVAVEILNNKHQNGRHD